MSFLSGVSAFFSKLETKAASEIKTLPERNWSSLRWLGLLALVALIIYNQTAKLLTIDSMAIVYRVFCVWLVCNTITRCVTIWGNTKVHVAEVTTLKVAEDGALDPDQGESPAQIITGQTGVGASLAQQIATPAAPVAPTKSP